jgi:hypothetical protein
VPGPADAVGALHTPLTLQELDPSSRYFPDLDLLDAGLGGGTRALPSSHPPVEYPAEALRAPSHRPDRRFRAPPRVVSKTEMPFLSEPTFGAWESHSCASVSGLLVTSRSAIMPLYRCSPHGREVHTIAALTLQVLRALASNRHASTACRAPRSRSSYSPTLRTTRARCPSARGA